MTSPTIVLVHGAFADASTWRRVYDHLARDGYTVLAPPNPLRGLPYDASYTESLIDQLDGPVVLAGHSYGGAVITVAGSSDKVAGLVYVAGVVPDEGESVNDLQGRFPSLAMGPLVQPLELADGSVEVSIDPARFPDVFGADLPADDAAFRAISQRPVAATAFDDPATAAAWRDEAVLGGVRHRRPSGRSGASPLLLRPCRLEGHRGGRRLPPGHVVPAGNRRRRHPRSGHRLHGQRGGLKPIPVVDPGSPDPGSTRHTVEL